MQSLQQSKTAIKKQEPNAIQVNSNTAKSSLPPPMQFNTTQAAPNEKDSPDREEESTQLSANWSFQEAPALPTQPFQFNRIEENSTENQNISGTDRQTGLPAQLKAGVESISGYSLDDVKVHYNSNQPAQLKAHAFAQGSDIHLGPGQEKHLPHEAWHVVQQKQGRVQPTVQMKSYQVNDDPVLEKEADVMGARAFKQGSYIGEPLQLKKTKSSKSIIGIDFAPIQMHPGHGGGGTARPEPRPAEPPVHAPAPSHDHASGESESDDTEAQIQAFKNRNYGPQNVSTSIGGRFDASYYPPLDRLFIDLSMGVDFMDVLFIDNSGNVTINPTGDAPTDARFNLVRAQASRVPLERRAEFVSNFQWSEAEKTAKMSDVRARNRESEGIWSNKHTFFIDKEGWEEVIANVSVTIFEHADSEPDDQLQTRVYKTPPNLDIGAWVNMAENRNQQGLMTLDDNELAPATGGGLLSHRVLFLNNSAQLSPNAQNYLRRFMITFSDDAATNRSDRNPANDTVDNRVMNKVKLIGRASATGDEEANRELAGQRVEAVKNFLVSRGFHGATEDRLETQNSGDEGAENDANWRRVDLIVGDGRAQNIMAHELGHVFGLDDEYATQRGSLIRGTGNPTGRQVSHDSMATGLGAANATAENNDGIMSLGNNVRPQHYATFGNALQQITSVPEWRIQNA